MHTLVPSDRCVNHHETPMTAYQLTCKELEGNTDFNYGSDNVELGGLQHEA
jgi:hypothetical protein